MQIDSFTVVLLGLFIKALLGALFLMFWLNERRTVWFAWWSAAFFLGLVSGVFFLLRGVVSDFVSIGMANAGMIAGFACCWQGARAFDHRPPLWLPMVAAPALWLAACLSPAFLDSLASRVVLSAVLSSSFLASSALEFWRGREEALRSRLPVTLVFASLALVMAARIPLIGVLPFPFGGLPVQPGWVGVFNLLLFFHTLVLTVLLVAMTKERLELEQRTKAETDPLTGALNRRAFMARGSRLILRHQIERKPLCLLFLDLDHFKSLNDRFGHSGGDDVLMDFVTLVHESMRPTDFLFRIGGEEFCCLLPDTTAAQAQLVAERIRSKFEATTVHVAGTPVKATVSIGIAPTEVFGYDIDTLMRRADNAVYAAKRQGRNRAVIATANEAVELRPRGLAIAG